LAIKPTSNSGNGANSSPLSISGYPVLLMLIVITLSLGKKMQYYDKKPM
jgi:hypothetical protein